MKCSYCDKEVGMLMNGLCNECEDEFHHRMEIAKTVEHLAKLINRTTDDIFDALENYNK